MSRLPLAASQAETMHDVSAKRPMPMYRDQTFLTLHINACNKGKVVKNLCCRVHARSERPSPDGQSRRSNKSSNGFRVCTYRLPARAVSVRPTVSSWSFALAHGRVRPSSLHWVAVLPSRFNPYAAALVYIVRKRNTSPLTERIAYFSRGANSTSSRETRHDVSRVILRTGLSSERLKLVPR